MRTQTALLRSICNVGGLTESMKVASSCEAHYIDLMPSAPGPTPTSRRVPVLPRSSTTLPSPPQTQHIAST